MLAPFDDRFAKTQKGVDSMRSSLVVDWFMYELSVRPRKNDENWIEFVLNNGGLVIVFNYNQV